MRRSFRIRISRIWIVPVLLGLIATVIASSRWALTWKGANGRIIVVWHGQIGVGVDKDPGGAGLTVSSSQTGLRWWFWEYRRPFVHIYYAPLWLAIPPMAAAAALRLGRAHRPRPGHCRCGYSLAGLDGKPCPECGRANA